MSDQPEFKPFSKLYRLFREMTITEKLDGTNAQVLITESGEIHAGSRNRWLNTTTKSGDNCGFAGWVNENKDELLKLGPGQHFGEWWGAGIQRRYGLTEKRFSLFNVNRWQAAYEATLNGHDTAFPKCVSLVPVLYKGPFSQNAVDATLESLRLEGSKAAPGFMDAEGIVVALQGTLYKVTLGGDGHKGETK